MITCLEGIACFVYLRRALASLWCSTWLAKFVKKERLLEATSLGDVTLIVHRSYKLHTMKGHSSETVKRFHSD